MMQSGDMQVVYPASLSISENPANPEYPSTTTEYPTTTDYPTTTTTEYSTTTATPGAVGFPLTYKEKDCADN